MKISKKSVLASVLAIGVGVAMTLTATVGATGVSQGSAGMWNASVKYRTSNYADNPSGYAIANIHAVSQSACQAQVDWYFLFSGSTLLLPCTYGAIGEVKTK
ncbi:MAG: hypothetical protein HYR92_05010 [Burkholderiales bacterium]|nr:hypothetical protein [Burkholderiales bacterium]